MSYTTIANVAGTFPAFARGTVQQKPADPLIRTYIDDAAGDLNAILQRRFSEVIKEQYGGNFAAFQAALTPDALNVLERINRYGAAAQLGETLASYGVAAAERLAQEFKDEYNRLIAELNGNADKGGSMAGGGLYDHLFDSQSATPSPRPALEGIAGGDQPKGQVPRDVGTSNFFGKFQKL
ncbi:MAG: hypothetical protein ACRD22_06590 [Terriglobia bacterium]